MTTPDAHALHGMFREALSRWASGVSVVAVRLPDGDVKAATATSFCSVSLDPPLVLVSLSQTSRTLEAVHHVSRFSISLLSVSQEEHSRRFGSQIEPPTGSYPETDGLLGALATLICTVHELHPCGDHTLVIGQVERIELADVTESPLLEPLIYYRRSYRTLG